VAREGSAQVSVLVKNVASRTGDEVVQLYVRPIDPKRSRALKELRGIERLTLKPGQQQRVSFSLIPNRDLAYYDVQRKGYAVDVGSYEVQLSASSSDIRMRSSFAVE